jgi:hypothetical protein
MALGGCATGQGLPTVQSRIGEPELLCTPALLEPFLVVISPDRSPPVWGEWQAGGRFDILWPPEFTLKLDAGGPSIVDGQGRVVASTGQLIADAGGSGGDPATICSLGGRTYPLS